MNFTIDYLLPFFYIILIAWLLQRNKFLRNGGFSSHFIYLFFVAKCVAGIVYTYTSIKYIPNADIPRFYADGLVMYNTFIKSPSAFWSQFRQAFYIHDFDLMNTQSSFILTVFEGIKTLHFFFNLLSFGNIYTNMILFNGLASLVFLRCWVFLKGYINNQTAGYWFFLMPSAFFYTAIILKEGIAFLLITAMLPLIHKLYKSFTFARFVGFLLLFALLFFFKFLIAVTFFITIAIWWLLSIFSNHKKLVVSSFVIVTISIFFSLGYIKPVLNLPKYIVGRQQEFLALEANSKIPVAILQPTFASFVNALPTALHNVLLKPLPGEGGKLMYLIFSFEIACFWALLLFLFIKNRFKASLKSIPPLVWGLFIFGIANLIIIGYTIPNIGAITRYRSIFLPFIGLFLWMAMNGNHFITRSQEIPKI